MKRLKQYNWKAIAIALLVVILSFGAWQYLSTKTNQAETQRKLETKQSELTKKINELDSTKLNAKQLEEAKKQLEQQKQELEKQLQAKRSTPKAYAESRPTYTPSGDKATWLAQSGIPQDQWGYVDYIVSRESGWRPCAYNPGMNDCTANPSTACGLVQQYPCHKIPGDWRDPVQALKWQYAYVQKYGGYAGAVAYWQVHHNY